MMSGRLVRWTFELHYSRLFSLPAFIRESLIEFALELVAISDLHRLHFLELPKKLNFSGRIVAVPFQPCHQLALTGDGLLGL